MSWIQLDCTESLGIQLQLLRFHLRQCVFLKVFASFWYLTYKNLHKNKMHVNWHTRFRFWHVVWLVKNKTTRQLTLYKLKQHVLLGMWHQGDILEEKVDVNRHSFLFWKTSRDTLDLTLNVKWNLSNIHNWICVGMNIVSWVNYGNLGSRSLRSRSSSTRSNIVKNSSYGTTKQGRMAL